MLGTFHSSMKLELVIIDISNSFSILWEYNILWLESRLSIQAIIIIISHWDTSSNLMWLLDV